MLRRASVRGEEESIGTSPYHAFQVAFSSSILRVPKHRNPSIGRRRFEKFLTVCLGNAPGNDISTTEDNFDLGGLDNFAVRDSVNAEG